MAIFSTLRMYLRRPRKLADPTDLYAHRVRLLDGTELDLKGLRGRPALIVNTASKCDCTPQYQGLQELHERFGRRGLQLLGPPPATSPATKVPPDDPQIIAALEAALPPSWALPAGELNPHLPRRRP